MHQAQPRAIQTLPELDALVPQAYGLSPDDDLLERLLIIDSELAAAEQGEDGDRQSLASH